MKIILLLGLFIQSCHGFFWNWNWNFVEKFKTSRLKPLPCSAQSLIEVNFSNDQEQFSFSISENVKERLSNASLPNFQQITVLGIARSGKSTLLSILADDNLGSFKTSHMESTPCTVGTMVANKTRVTPKGKNVLFVDSEGQGFNLKIRDSSRNEEYDNRLALSFIQTSKVVILNFMSFSPADINKELERIAFILIASKGDSGISKHGHLHLVVQRFDDGIKTLRDQFPFFEEEHEVKDKKVWLKYAPIREAFTTISIWALPRESEMLNYKKNFSKKYLKVVKEIQTTIYNQVDSSDDKSYSGTEYLGILNNIVET
eukprot:Pgem_evm2s6965